jgi:hypothetical protein
VIFNIVRPSKPTTRFTSRIRKPFPYECTHEWKRCTEPVRFEKCNHGPIFSNWVARFFSRKILVTTRKNIRSCLFNIVRPQQANCLACVRIRKAFRFSAIAKTKRYTGHVMTEKRTRGPREIFCNGKKLYVTTKFHL